jgi:hypothetical protein
MVWQMMINDEPQNVFVVADSIGKAIGHFRKGWRSSGTAPVTPDKVDAVVVDLIAMLTEKGEFGIVFGGNV